MSELSGLRVALVHDALVDTGGAERVVLVFCRMFPEAPLYTLAYKPDWTFGEFKKVDVRTSFVQKLVVSRTAFKALFPLYPLAFEQFDLSGYDLVLSSSAHWAKGVITRPETCHVCYCNAPSRVAWRYHEYVAQESFGRLARFVLPLFVKALRDWDVITERRVDYFVAGSHNCARRIAKYYRRRATVVPSPIDVSRAILAGSIGDYFLVVSRLNSYKRIDVAVEAFRRLGRPLKVVGAGPRLKALKAQAPANVEFLGRVSEERLAELYASCRALIVCAEEDYGLTALEAQASGRPVVAYGEGGVLETVLDGQTGIFFDRQTPEALAEAIGRLEALRFDPERARRQAAQFDETVFVRRLEEVLVEKLVEHRRRFAVRRTGE